MTPSYTPPQFSLPGIRDPRRDYPFESLSVQCGTTPSNSNTSIQRPLARHRVLLSRRVIAYYGLIRDSESLSATYEFAAESAAPKEIGFGWESRGSPIDSAGLCSRAASLTPVAPKSANDCYFLLGLSLHLLEKGSAITLDISRLQSSFRAYFALILRPASWLALLSRTFTFELSLAGSPRASVEYNYVGKQSIPTTGLSPASPTALWAAEQGLTPLAFQGLTPRAFVSKRKAYREPE